MTLSWLAFGALAIAAATFAAWIYFRRELPIPGRKILGVARGLVLVLVLLLVLVQLLVYVSLLLLLLLLE